MTFWLGSQIFARAADRDHGGVEMSDNVDRKFLLLESNSEDDDDDRNGDTSGDGGGAFDKTTINTI